MKIIYRSIVLLIALFFIAACAEEPIMKGDANFILSFQRDGRTTAMAGTTFYVLPTGAGDFLTLYNGTKGHVWGVEGATGSDFNKLDSLGVTFDSIGNYPVSVVATTIGKLGEKIIKLVKTVDVSVVDERNTITNYYLGSLIGTITNDNEILFSVPDATTNFTFKPAFVLGSNSAACTVMVNGVPQVSLVTEQTFTPSVPIIYTVKSPLGVERNYSVKITTYKSSAECKLLKFSLGSGTGTNAFGEVGVIDEANKIINLNVNYATALGGVILVAENSYASTLKIINSTFSPKKLYPLSNSTTLKVTAEDKVTIGIYGLNISVQNPVTDFTFAGFVPAPVRVIDVAAKTITIDLAKGTDISKLKAVWTGSLGTVSLKYGTNDSIQSNGVTVNDFTSPKKYTFYKGNTTAGDEYAVSVNLK